MTRDDLLFTASMRCVCALWVWGLLLSANSMLFADESEIERLIDALIEIDEPGIGYSTWFSGSGFLPYPDSEELGTFILGATHRQPSSTLRKIVEQGVVAVPVLLQHIDDQRKVNIPRLVADGMVWMEFPDEYDFNPLTRPHAPPDVNRGILLNEKEQHPNEHVITVGDLCFVALGQIVNRNFAATRYQPTAGIIVNSPTYSERLRRIILKDWSDLTADKHKQSLTEDFLRADHDGRRLGAYLRLSFYYPEAVEQLVLDELTKPTFDTSVIFDFCRNILYKAEAPAERRRFYDEFIGKYGNVYSEGIQQQLFEDLDYLEATEEKRVRPPLTEFGTQPRELLIQLFGYPESLRSIDRPFVQAANKYERSRFIRTLVHDDSQRIGEAVKELFLHSPTDEDFAPACLRCLANRGDAAFLVEQLDQIDLSQQTTNPLHRDFIDALSTSRDPLVQQKLFDLVNTTMNEDYFMAGLPAVGREQDQLILAMAQKLLANLPAETGQGESLLGLIRDRFPQESKAIFESFLEPNSAARIGTMCDVLWYGHPLAPEILSPFLEDDRELQGFIKRTRVRDRVKEAIGNYDRKAGTSDDR